jgi:hypothetical protein
VRRIVGAFTGSKVEMLEYSARGAAGVAAAEAAKGRGSTDCGATSGTGGATDLNDKRSKWKNRETSRPSPGLKIDC